MFGWLRHLWFKYLVCPRALRPCLRFKLDKETKEQLMRNGWHDTPHLMSSKLVVNKSKMIE